MWRLTSKAKARQLTANESHGKDLIGLFWSSLHFAFFGRMKWAGKYGLGSSVAQRKAYFCPNYCTIAAEAVIRQLGRSELWYTVAVRARLIAVLPQWVLHYCNIKPSTQLQRSVSSLHSASPSSTSLPPLCTLCSDGLKATLQSWYDWTG